MNVTLQAIGPLPADGKVPPILLKESSGRVLAQVSVEVPRTARLALAGMLPNPGGREAAVRFQLPRAAPARLELLDIAGRRLLRREVGSLGPGTQDGHAAL